MAAAEDMAAEEVHTETGFGTGLRAKLGRAPEGEAEAQAPPPPGDEGFAPPLVESRSKNFLTMSLEEIAQGKLDVSPVDKNT